MDRSPATGSALRSFHSCEAVFKGIPEGREGSAAGLGFNTMGESAQAACGRRLDIRRNAIARKNH